MYVAKQKCTHRYKKTNLWLLVVTSGEREGGARGMGLRDA